MAPLSPNIRTHVLNMSAEVPKWNKLMKKMSSLLSVCALLNKPKNVSVDETLNVKTNVLSGTKKSENSRSMSLKSTTRLKLVTFGSVSF